MANELIKQNYKDIADAIRSKTGKNSLMTAEEMPTEIGSIEAGFTPTGNKNITTTDQVDVTEFATAQVQEPNLVAANIKKDVSILGVIGTNEGYPEPTGSINITENGTHNVKNKAQANVYIQSDLKLSFPLSYNNELAASDNSFSLGCDDTNTIDGLDITLPDMTGLYTVSDISDTSELESELRDPRHGSYNNQISTSFSTYLPICLDIDSDNLYKWLHVSDSHPTITVQQTPLSEDEVKSVFESVFPDGLTVYDAEGNLLGNISWTDSDLYWYVSGGC